VVDDGLQMRLVFAPRTELPALYVRTADGTEALVNTHVENDTVIVHRLAERLVVRRGLRVGCIVNKDYWKTEQRPASGTLSDQVERSTGGPSR
jgi:type IV secretion system protein VirB9